MRLMMAANAWVLMLIKWKIFSYIELCVQLPLSKKTL